MRRMACSGFVLVCGWVCLAAAAEPYRSVALYEPCDPYSVGLHAPKLVTPQWVGKPGVEAVIVLSADDLRQTAQFEAFLRPILERLKQIDGRAPLSLMANRVDPKDPHLQDWLREGLSLETHTLVHPCPLLQSGDLAKAKKTFDGSIELMASIRGNSPVAFRMPCCDSISSVSPRFFTEVFSKTTPAGRFLAIDSSVMMLYTSADADLPRELVVAADGKERFRPYVPAGRIMANLIENYPYPYVINRLCWEIPVLMPSDWDAQHRNGLCSSQSVADWKAAVDATVIKQGIVALCFHCHGWIRSDQIIELIDHMVAKHGSRILFLSFHEVYQRLTQNLLGGHPLRAPDGGDHGVRLVDVDQDGYMDVVIDHPRQMRYRRWLPAAGKWAESKQLPPQLLRCPQLVSQGEGTAGGFRLVDLDGDRRREAMVAQGGHTRVFRFPTGGAITAWEPLSWTLPEGVAMLDRQGRDAGLRLVDLDEDGDLDLVFSNARHYAIHLFTSPQQGWSQCVLSGERAKDRPGPLPPIVRSDGTNNGVWFAGGRMWVQNEETGAKLPGHVESHSFEELLSAGN